MPVNRIEYTDVVIYDAEIEAETKDPVMPDGPFYLALVQQIERIFFSWVSHR